MSPISVAAVEVVERMLDHMGYDAFYTGGWERFPDGWNKNHLAFVSEKQEPMGITVWTKEEGEYVSLILCHQGDERIKYAKAKVPSLDELNATVTVGWSRVDYVKGETFLPWFSAHLVDDPEQLPP